LNEEELGESISFSLEAELPSHLPSFRPQSAELNAQKALEKSGKASRNSNVGVGTGNGKNRASISSSISSETSSSRPRGIKRNSSNLSLLGNGNGVGNSASPRRDFKIEASRITTSQSPIPFNHSHVQAEGPNPELNNAQPPSLPQSHNRVFSTFEPQPSFTFGSEATSLEYSMLSSMLNDIDPSLIGGGSSVGGTGTPDWNQLSPRTFSENSDEYRLGRYDGVAAPSGLNPASMGVHGTGTNGNGEGFEGVIGSQEAMDGFTNWNGTNGAEGEINGGSHNGNANGSNINPTPSRKSSRISKSKNNNNHFLPSLMSLSNPSTSNSTSSSSNVFQKPKSLQSSLLSNISTQDLESSTASGSGSTNPKPNSNPDLLEEEREPTSAALTDSQVRARHASVFDPDPNSISEAAWKERVGKVYARKIKPFPYTEGYHFLLKHCTEKWVEDSSEGVEKVSLTDPLFCFCPASKKQTF